MTPRILIAALLTTPLLLAAAPAPTPSPLADVTLQAAAQLDLPSVVTVVQNVTGALSDSGDGKTHGPYIGAFAGTGFFITGDGYLITASHVAAPSADEVKDELVDFYIDDTFKCDPGKSADHCQSVQDSHHDDVASRVTAVNPSVDLRVLTQDMNPVDDGLPAKLISNSPTLEQDNAVVKIDGKNEPVALLGDSSRVSLQSTLAVIGYPSSGQNKGPTLVPTLTSGNVVASRKGDPGKFSGIGGTADLLQIDAHTEHGNSGGPGVQSDGAVIGIVSFGDTHNRNYLIASNDVVADVARTPANNHLSQIDTLYRDGLNAFHKGDYSAAKGLFDQCAAMNPVQIYCKDLALQSGNGGPAQSSNSTLGDSALGWAERGLWSVIGALLGAGICLLALRRRLRPVPGSAAHGPATETGPTIQPALAGYGGYNASQGVQTQPPVPRQQPALYPQAPPMFAQPSPYPTHPGTMPRPGYPVQQPGYHSPPYGYAGPQAPAYPSPMPPPTAHFPYPPMTPPSGIPSPPAQPSPAVPPPSAPPAPEPPAASPAAVMPI